MCPVDRITIITAKPAHAALPMSVSEFVYFWFTMGPAVAAKMRMNVPTNSAPSLRVREMSGTEKSVRHVCGAPHVGASIGKH